MPYVAAVDPATLRCTKMIVGVGGEIRIIIDKRESGRVNIYVMDLQWICKV